MPSSKGISTKNNKIFRNRIDSQRSFKNVSSRNTSNLLDYMESGDFESNGNLSYDDLRFTMNQTMAKNL